MKKHSIPQWQISGFLFTSITGTFLHFLFDLTGGSVAAALLSAVNESIWEHMKLLFYPMVIFALIESRVWGRQYPTFWCVKMKGVLLGILLIPAVYYSYTGIFGVSVDWFNIALFFLVAGIVFRWETLVLQQGRSCKLTSGLAVTILAALALIFTVFTFVPPHIPLFQDPMTRSYGFIRE